MKPMYTIWCLTVLACTVLLTGNVFAQSTTTASISGRIVAKTGESLPGVNIVAVHDPSGTKYGTSSRQDGRFTLPNLRVGGPYTVTASIIGYQKQTRTQIYLRLSENLDLNFSMVEEAVQAGEVTVVGERTSVFNSSRTGAASNVTRDQIDRLPTLTRNFQDYYKVSPYFAGDKGNAVGRNSKYNNIQIDGTNANDIFGLGSSGTPAGQSATIPGSVNPISLDAIEEFQVVVSPFDVRQAGFTGAGINAITRSGTNTPKGSLFYYGRNQDFVGKKPDSTKAKLDGFTDWSYGFRVGGPLVENNLFYFVTGEVTRYTAPLTRTFGNQNIGTNAYAVTKDSLDLLSNYLKTKYNYDPGSWDAIDLKRETEKLFTRLDLNISESHKATVRWNYLHSVEDNRPSRGSGPLDIYAANARYQLANKTHSVALQLTSIFGSSASNEFILGYVDQFDQPYFLGSPFPTLYIRTSNPSAADKRTQTLDLGAEEFRHYNELGQKYFEITNNFSWYLPGHTLTAGAKVDFLKFRNLFIPDAFGAYTYNSIADFLADKKAASYSYRYSNTADPLQEANWNATQYGFYVQDQWVATPLLTITLGVRVDVPTYPATPNYNFLIDSTFGLRTDVLPKTSLAFSPRVGFNWALDEERTAQIRGGAGIFYGRFPYVWVSNQYSNTGVDFITVTAAPNKFVPDPNNQGGKGAITTAEVDLTDRNFKAPSVVRGTLAVDYKLPFDLVATVEGVYSVTQNDVYYQNINLKGVQDNAKTSGGTTRTAGPLTPGGKIVGENREVWGILKDSTAYTTQWVNNQFSPGVFLVKNTSKGSNLNLVAQIQRNAAEGINGGVSYTYGRAKDIASGNSTTASSGWRFNPTPGNPNDPQLTYSQWDRRHRISANASYRHEWGTTGLATTIGIFYTGLSGRPFSYYVDGDVNGDGRIDNDLPYIPKDANDVILMGLKDPTLPQSGTNPIIKLTDKSRAEYSQFMAYIESDDYLKANRGKIAERSGPREPWAHQIDLHFGQEIPMFSGQRLELAFDITNLLNLLNSEWGWVRTTGANQTVILTQLHSFETTAGPDYGKPRYRWLGISDPYPPDNIASRWQAQFGVRYTF